MNKISSSLGSNSITLALLAVVLVISTAASAKDHKPKASNNQARVVAHIEFTGLSPVDMAMQKKLNDKYYLYVQHSKDQGISIIDITKPAEPKTVGVTPWPDPASPRVVQKFSGVIKWLQDERDFIYVLNAEGLWIVSKPPEHKIDQSDASNSYGE